MWEKEAGPSPTAAPCPWGQPCHPVTPAGPCSLLPPGPSLPQRCRPGRVLEHCLQGCGKRLLGTSHPPLLPPSPPASPQAAPPKLPGDRDAYSWIWSVALGSGGRGLSSHSVLHTLAVRQGGWPDLGHRQS